MIIKNCREIYKVIKARKAELKMRWRDISAKCAILMGTIKGWEYHRSMRVDTLLPVLDALGLEMVIREKAPDGEQS